MGNFKVELGGKTMTTKHLISTLAVLLVLASCVCAVSANTLTVGSKVFATVGEQGDIDLYLDSAPTGLSGYKVTFTITDSSVADILDVKYPTWSVADYRYSSAGPNNPNNVNIKVADVTDGIPVSARAIYLGSVTVIGKQAGKETPITVTVNLMDDNDGSAVNPTVVPGSIKVDVPPGSIQVSSTPIGAKIYLDGADTGLTTSTPYTTLNLVTAGVHTVKVSLSGYVDAAQDVTVVSGQPVPVSFALRRPVTIIVKSVPTSADIYINGQKMVPPTDYTFTGMPAGTYTVQVTKSNYYSKSTTRTLSPGVTSTFSFTLSISNEIEPPPKYGSIAIDSTPPGATVIIDGTPQIDLQTPATIETSVGPHDVTVKLDTYLTPPVQTVTVERDTTKSVTFTLESAVPAIVKIVPRSLNIASKGAFVAFVTLPTGYKAADVDAKSVVCEGAPALRLIRVKLFPRTFAAIFSREKLVNVKAGDSVPLTVVGTIKYNGQNVKFAGSDTIKVISKKGTLKEDIEGVDKMTDEKVFSQFNPGYDKNDEKVFSQPNQRDDNNNNGKDNGKSR
jgi:hypothetical protein